MARYGVDLPDGVIAPIAMSLGAAHAVENQVQFFFKGGSRTQYELFVQMADWGACNGQYNRTHNIYIRVQSAGDRLAPADNSAFGDGTGFIKVEKIDMLDMVRFHSNQKGKKKVQKKKKKKKKTGEEKK